MFLTLFQPPHALPLPPPRPPALLSPRRAPHCALPPPPPPPSLNEQLIRQAMLNDHPGVESLLSAGASATYASRLNSSFMTALMWSSSEGNVAITRSLLSAGADPNMRTSLGLTALIYAFENLPSANPRPAPPAGFPGSPTRRGGVPPPQTAVFARKTGHGDVIKMLLGAGADIRVVNEHGETAVHMAARKAQKGWVEVGLAGGVGVDSRSGRGEESAMHVAAKEGHADVVRVLVGAGGDVEARGAFGWTPLVWAAACGNVECVRVLLECGADANVRTWEGGVGTTALREGRRSGRPQAVEKLLREAGARD